ncbi:hypothetical protein AGMMS50256_39100 [Betaproteobacteria bacterium]|nr:hypothetical protein AGMMS50256_39100 [Betaproteobacteria bacterium]
MKKQWIAIVALFLLGPVAVGNAFADRRHGGRGHGHGYHGYSHSRVDVGVLIGSPFWSPRYYPAPYYYPSYYPTYHPPVVIERQTPPVYVEIEQSSPVESRAQAGYWYYCQSPSGYYPEVQECPKGWVKVPPRP